MVFRKKKKKKIGWRIDPTSELTSLTFSPDLNKGTELGIVFSLSLNRLYLRILEIVEKMSSSFDIVMSLYCVCSNLSGEPQPNLVQTSLVSGVNTHTPWSQNSQSQPLSAWLTFRVLTRLFD